MCHRRSCNPSHQVSNLEKNAIEKHTFRNYLCYLFAIYFLSNMFSSAILERVSFVYYRQFNGNDGPGGAQVIEMDNEEVNRHAQDLDDVQLHLS